MPWILLDKEISLHLKQCITIFITTTTIKATNNDLCMYYVIHIFYFNLICKITCILVIYLASFLKLRKLRLREGKLLAYFLYSTDL